ncbi:MAG TPA: PQQ-binding-like beta-propeller repeat protein [Streptosporangiaceae bacterium]|nr:PQQ-binding-like beta-propeller repeat protein [Streptosporangiaceae bacterium]
MGLTLGGVRIRSLPALALAGLFATGLLSACSSAAAPRGPSSSPAATSPPASNPAISLPQPATDWLEYHGNGARTGVATGLPAAGRLATAWSARLGAAVYGQPLVIGSTVVAATEADEVYGLAAASGAIRWRVRVGTPLPLSQQPCGLLNPLGITGTGVYDPQTQLAYFLAQSGKREHLLVGIDPATGAIRFRRSVPSPDRQPAYDQQRAALALADGHVYVAFGGHYGDCGHYIGSVVAVPASGNGSIRAYRVPTALQGGIWAAGGPVVGPDGTIYVAVGNGARTSGSYDGSNSVTALTPQLGVAGIFAPTNWRALSAGDADLGSESPALLSDGRILQVGKTGVGYLLNADHLGGVGGQLASARVCPTPDGAYGGPAVLGSVVYVPCNTGLVAVDTAGDHIAVRWHGPANVGGSPVLGGGAVWVASPSNGRLYELDPRTGAVRQQISLGGPLPHFVSPSLSGGLVLVGTMTGVTAVSGG